MNINNVKFGYEVTDLDYGSERDACEVRELIALGRFCIIKNPKGVEPKQLVQLYKNIGTVVAQSEKVKSAGAGGFQELVRVRHDAMFAGEHGSGELVWHNASMNRHTGDQIIAMYMYDISKATGGMTGFTDGQGSFEDLDDKNKQKFMQYHVEYPDWDMKGAMETDDGFEKTYFRVVFASREEGVNFRDANWTPEAGESAPLGKQIRYHPLVTKHPWSGRPGFKFNFPLLHSIKELPQERAQAFIKELTNWMLQDKYVYYHEWENNDIVLNDQLHSLHKRTPYQGFRELWRTGINYKGVADYWE